MSPQQHLYYALGQAAYAIALADGEVQKEERQRFHDIMAEELRAEKAGYEISLIVFQAMDKGRKSKEISFGEALKLIRLYQRYFSPAMKKSFLKVLERVAEAFPPVTRAESELIVTFTGEIEGMFVNDQKSSKQS